MLVTSYILACNFHFITQYYQSQVFYRPRSPNRSAIFISRSDPVFHTAITITIKNRSGKTGERFGSENRIPVPSEKSIHEYILQSRMVFNSYKKKRTHSTFAQTYANRWNAVMCPKIPKRTKSQPNHERLNPRTVQLIGKSSSITPTTRMSTRRSALPRIPP